MKVNEVKDRTGSDDLFHFQTLDELCDQADRLNLKLPVSCDISILREPVAIGGRTTPNRLCVQPMEGCDADAGGAPGVLTFRRYQRYAEGGFGLIWLEATAVEAHGRSNPGQLWINRRNVNGFAALVKDIRESARKRWDHEVTLILQLGHSGRYSRPNGVDDPMIAFHDPALDAKLKIPSDYPVVSDDYLDRLQDATVAAAHLAFEAGFDGVDIKACHGDLLAELLCATMRSGRYGGSLENRSRFLREVIGKLSVLHPELLLASRISVNSALSESDDSLELARILESAGVQLLSVTEACDSADPLGERAHPIEKFMRLLKSTCAIQNALPDVPVVAGGLSWFRHFLPDVAAGVLNGGCATLIGLGRTALAYPSLAADLLQGGHLEPDACCINCAACIQLIKDGGHAGCVVMDSEIYGEEYIRNRHFAIDNLRDEAKRCRGCAPAPCRTACPTHIDVPAFLKAFADDDLEKAYAIMRETNCLPGMCSHLCPVNTLCEGRCVAGTLDGKPIPIHDIQYAVYWNALCNGFITLNLPEADTGKTVGVVGAGPTGIACAITLLERGHHVVVYERSSRLGGTPELLIRSSRFAGAHDEVEHLLRPALSGARLSVRHGVELGRDISLDQLRSDHDAVLLAAGVWGEKSIGEAGGVLSGIDFLFKAKNGTLREVPERVVLLAGGDSAMDCAKVVLELGASELLIVYAGSLSEMHWHMEDSWFRTEGVNLLTMTPPLCYRSGGDGQVKGLQIQRSLTSTEEILETTMVIEAMGLSVETSLIESLSECSFSENALLKTGENSFSCGVSAVFAAGGMINGGDSVVQCIAEGMASGREIDEFLQD